LFQEEHHPEVTVAPTALEGIQFQEKLIWLLFTQAWRKKHTVGIPLLSQQEAMKNASGSA
jgi:hypothetical protein